MKTTKKSKLLKKVIDIKLFMYYYLIISDATVARSRTNDVCNKREKRKERVYRVSIAELQN